MLNWHLICLIYEISMSSISLMLNALVVSLCIHKLSDSMRLYRKFFIFGATIDSIYAVITILTHMMLVDHGTKMIFVLDSPFLPATSLCARISAALLVFCAHLMIWSFVNRINIFCWQNYYSMGQIIGFAAIYLLWVIAHGFIAFFALDIHDDPTTTRELSLNPVFVGRKVPPYSAGDTYNGPMIFVLIEVQILLSSYYSLIFYCGYKIRQKLREDREVLQTKTIRIQARLTRILTTQAVLPLITVVCPIGSMCVLPLAGVSFEYLGVFTKLTINILPIINPLVILITIPRFRKSLLFFANKRFSASIRPSVISTSSMNRNHPNLSSF
ncbi:hypothetical protein M3Y96_00417200 [Aphelenchoides besseyi]|nr:hypothetical protein M3Y96_00417200 [Aphelenchoides besseyi]